MIQVPEVVGLTLCKRLAFAPGLARMSLIGVFHSLRFAFFPTLPQQFTVYAALTDAVGEGEATLTITRLETDSIIHRVRKWFAFPNDRLLTLNMEVKVRTCVFPAPGRYMGELHFDNEFASQKAIQVMEEMS